MKELLKRQRKALNTSKCIYCSMFLEKRWHHVEYTPAGYLYTGECPKAGQLSLSYHAVPIGEGVS